MLLVLIIRLVVITLGCHLWFNTLLKKITALGVEQCLFLWILKPRSALLMVSSQNHSQLIIPCYATWCKCNSTVLAWLFNSISKDLHPSVVYFKIAREVWVDLQYRYSQGNGHQIFVLRQEVCSLIGQCILSKRTNLLCQLKNLRTITLRIPIF